MNQARILVIDDELTNRLILEETLAPHYAVQALPDGLAAQQYLSGGGAVDLVLSDVMMPHMDGFAFCRWLKADERTRDIPLLFLTSLDSDADEEKGFLLGAEDFIHKPISPAIVLARVRTHLELARTRVQLHARNADLELLVIQRTHELLAQKQQVISAQGAVITAFCSLAEARDNETGNHIQRTQRYVEALGRRLMSHPRFAPELDEETLQLLFKSAPLHDIGKVAIPDAILLKPGSLSSEEWTIMRRHTEFGHAAILEAGRNLGDTAGFLRYASEIAWCHHEKWDGGGYPRGLAGEAIPLSARLMAVADVYDALISKRVYKPAYPHEQAAKIINEGSGRHFDPDVAAAFGEIEEEFRDIAASFRDEEA
jgi:putative two-component system response regulator